MTKNTDKVYFHTSCGGVLTEAGECQECQTKPDAATCRGIVNTHEQLRVARARGFEKRHCLAIVSGRHSTVTVYSPFFQTDPDSAWYDNKCKAFHGLGGGRARRIMAIDDAKAWVAGTYGYAGEWKMNGCRDVVPAEIAKRFPIRKSP